MSRQKNYLTILGLAIVGGILFPLVRTDNSVHILSKYGQLVTSSTLNWLPLAHYDPSKEIVIGGFQEIEQEPYNDQAEVERRPLFVCRALHIGVWVSGSQKDGEKRCTVTIHGNVHSYERYELLENVESAARLSWVPWNKFVQTPVGAVATDQMYVARRDARDDDSENADRQRVRYTHYIGTFNSKDNLGTIVYVKDNGVEGSAKSGDVLVETEPIYYELTNIKLNWLKRQVKKRTPRLLAEGTIRNTGVEPATMAEGFGYTYNYSIYWGQGHAILKGLNTSITLSNGTFLPNLIWGLEERDNNRQDVYTVDVYLEPGTGVNVSLRANYTDMEVPYTGKLVSHYEDGTTRAREIGGVRREEAMFDVRPEFGPVYFLNNFSLVPTTTMPPNTEPPSTVKPPLQPTPAPTASSPWEPNKKPVIDIVDGNHDENLIIPPKKSDGSNMQSDDGGPLSLKNKVEVARSAARCSGLQSAVLVIATSVVPRLFAILPRIT